MAIQPATSGRLQALRSDTPAIVHPIASAVMGGARSPSPASDGSCAEAELMSPLVSGCIPANPLSSRAITAAAALEDWRYPINLREGEASAAPGPLA
jgi:hypothetical protein